MAPVPGCAGASRTRSRAPRPGAPLRPRVPRAGLAARDIAREAKVADGALSNYFEDKEDLLAHALLAHVGSVMGSRPPMPSPGTGTVAENLREFIDGGLATLSRVLPAFAGLRSQPKVLQRFHAMVGGERAFGAVAILIVGAIHGQILPAAPFRPPGTPVAIPPGFAGRLVETILTGIAPGGEARQARR